MGSNLRNINCGRQTERDRDNNRPESDKDRSHNKGEDPELGRVRDRIPVLAKKKGKKIDLSKKGQSLFEEENKDQNNKDNRGGPRKKNGLLDYKFEQGLHHIGTKYIFRTISCPFLLIAKSINDFTFSFGSSLV